MKISFIAWCEDGNIEPLDLHMAASALIALEVYWDEWRYVSRRYGAPHWILPLTAAYHDVGKAVPAFQDRASRSCRMGRKPSFPLHEYIGAIPLLTASYVEDWKDPQESLWLSVAAAGVILHHHGMSGRLKFMNEAMKKLSNTIKAALNTQVVLLMAEIGLEACKLAYEVSTRLGTRHSSTLEQCVGAASKMKERLESGESSIPGIIHELQIKHTGFPAEPPWWVTELFGESPMLGDKAPMERGLESYWALSTFIGGAISLADTAVSSYWRGGGISGYALRVLGEDPRRLKAAKSLLDRIRVATGGGEGLWQGPTSTR